MNKLKKIWLFIRRFKLNFNVFVGKPEGSDELNKDFQDDFNEEISGRK